MPKLPYPSMGSRMPARVQPINSIIILSMILAPRIPSALLLVELAAGPLIFPVTRYIIAILAFSGIMEL